MEHLEKIRKMLSSSIQVGSSLGEYLSPKQVINEVQSLDIIGDAFPGQLGGSNDIKPWFPIEIHFAQNIKKGGRVSTWNKPGQYLTTERDCPALRKVERLSQTFFELKIMLYRNHG